MIAELFTRADGVYYHEGAIAIPDWIVVVVAIALVALVVWLVARKKR